MATRRLKHGYIETFGIVVMLLALVRCAFPGIATVEGVETEATVAETKEKTSEETARRSATVDSFQTPEPQRANTTTLYVNDGGKPHPIRSVPSYADCFPDSNHVQLKAAKHWGVPPVKNRSDAEARKSEVVYMGLSPYYALAHLDASIPYLVPRAAILLEDIGRSFLDSLQVKGLPLHRVVVSSVLRSEDDVARLRRSNKNATEQSCHLYGTTFDINYNVYEPVDTRRSVPDDKLKFVLSEVLRDMRSQGRCYIKYEVKQPCFHITVR